MTIVNDSNATANKPADLAPTQEENDADEEDAEVEPGTEPDRDPLPPLLALRCDGRILLSTHDLEGIDLTTRETFVGIVLSEAETSDVLDRTDDAFLEAAARIAGLIRRKGKRVTSH